MKTNHLIVGLMAVAAAITVATHLFAATTDISFACEKTGTAKDAPEVHQTSLLASLVKQAKKAQDEWIHEYDLK